MEHESFSDVNIAHLMNKNFLCIKVDREELPHIDQYYMDAVQLMSGRGGWPLNVICLPDMRPIFGGTYFRPTQWTSLLNSIAELWEREPERLFASAEQCSSILAEQSLKADTREYGNGIPSQAQILQAISQWSASFDPEYGGDSRVPKFPMPCALRFLLQWSRSALETDAEEFAVKVRLHVFRSIDSMLRGGIWDHVAGGWARYSTDRRWKLPHFEKMLYDNAQLVALVSEAYMQQPEPRWKQVIEQSVEFLHSSFGVASGLYGAALDADSEGEEGLYYTWTRDEINNVLGTDAEWFCQHYGVNDSEELEDGRYVLFPAASAPDHEADTDWNDSRAERCLELLRDARAKRVPPAFDPKALCSWNALMVSALTKAGIALESLRYADQAQQLLRNILGYCRRDDGLLRCAPVGAYADVPAVPAMADDYVLLAMACLDVYELSADNVFLKHAESLCDELLRDFRVADQATISYARVSEDMPPTREETHDTVIPSSSAVFCRVLLHCGTISGRADFLDFSRAMMSRQTDTMLSQPAFHAEWLHAATEWLAPFIVTHLSIAQNDYAHALRRQLSFSRVVCNGDGLRTSEATVCDQTRCLNTDISSLLQVTAEMRGLG